MRVFKPTKQREGRNLWNECERAETKWVWRYMNKKSNVGDLIHFREKKERMLKRNEREQNEEKGLKFPQRSKPKEEWDERNERNEYARTGGEDKLEWIAEVEKSKWELTRVEGRKSLAGVAWGLEDYLPRRKVKPYSSETQEGWLLEVKGEKTCRLVLRWLFVKNSRWRVEMLKHFETPNQKPCFEEQWINLGRIIERFLESRSSNPNRSSSL